MGAVKIRNSHSIIVVFGVDAPIGGLIAGLTTGPHVKLKTARDRIDAARIAFRVTVGAGIAVYRMRCKPCIRLSKACYERKRRCRTLHSASSEEARNPRINYFSLEPSPTKCSISIPRQQLRGIALASERLVFTTNNFRQVVAAAR